ncbi:MAG: hypothetical protein M1308_22610 [Actinobacteria bacterium]|nr:hypothetical protein [Actinomycetota bacterium]
MRAFNYITVGKILSDLKKDGLNLGRATFYRLEKKLRFPFKEKSGGAWRVYTPSENLKIYREVIHWII